MPRTVNHEAISRRKERIEQKARAKEQIESTSEEPYLKPGQFEMDGVVYNSFLELFLNGLSKEEQDIILGKNPYVKTNL